MSPDSIPMTENPLQVVAACAANWLRFAAAPAFAIMALLTGVLSGDGGMPDMPGMPASASSPLTGMVAMYLLMSLFHLVPWLKLIADRRGGRPF